MLKQIVRLRVGLVLLLGILLFCSGAFATGNDYGGNNRRDNRGDHRGDNRGDHRGDNRWDHRGDRHFYRDGRWYKHDSRGNEVSVADIIIGAIAEALPPQHTTVIVQNTSYYYDNVHYYRQRPEGGYIVVEAPRRG